MGACGPSGSGSLDGGANGDGRDTPTCDQVEPVDVTTGTPPDLLLVVDKSQSMQSSLFTGENKWETMRDAMAKVSADYSGGINLGLSLYPRGAACDSGLIDVAISVSSSADIAAELASISPAGATPTHLTLEAALAYFNSIAPNPAGRYVILATDGVPNCGYDAVGDRNSSKVSSQTESVAAITALRSAGITTYVVGFDGDAIPDDSSLVAMASAAGTGPYVAANSPQELNQALSEISSQIGVEVCTVDLDSLPEDADKLDVYLDNVQIARTPSHADGWDYDSGTNCVTFYGSPCNDLRAGSVAAIRVDYGCPGPIVN